jgi:CHAT domain-containing protein/tetratricopeptide (TPR) repeat protein
MKNSPWAFTAAALLLSCAAGRARAESYTYQGQVQIQNVPGDPCAITSSEAGYSITVYSRDDSLMQRIDGYLEGEKIVRAHVTGNDLAQLRVTYPGEGSPGHVMRLRQLGDGSFVGTFEAKTMVAALSGCGFTNATIKFTRTAVHTPDAYAQAARMFQMDMRAVDAYERGLRGKVKEALPVLQQDLASREQLLGEEHPQVLPYYFFLAQLHDAAGSYPQEIPLFGKSLAVCERAYGPQSTCTALMLTSLGAAQNRDGDYAGAEVSLRRAQAICDKVAGAEAPFSGALLNALSAVLIYTGRYGEADRMVTHALAVNAKASGPESVNVGVSLINQAMLYRFTGQYAKAEAAGRRSLAVNQKALGANNPLVILNAIGLGQILRIEGKYTEAEPLSRQGLAAAEKVLGPERPDHPALTSGLIGLGELLRETGRYKEAEPLYRRALANNEKFLGPDHPDVATVSLLYAKLLRATGRDDEALTLLKRAYRISHASDNQIIAWRVPAELMGAYDSGKAAQPSMAIFFGKEAINKLQALRGNMAGAGDEAQQAFISAEEVKSVYRTLANLLIADRRLSEAQQVLAMLKEQEFYDYTQRGGADLPKTVARLNSTERDLDDLNSKGASLGKEYGALQEKFKKDKMLSVKDRERLAVLRKEMDAAQATFEARAAEVAKNSADPEAQKRRSQEINDFSRSFQGTLKGMGHDAVLAQYFILDDHVEILLTTPNAVLARQAPVKRQELNDKIAAYRKTLASPSQDPLPQSRELYRLLVGPIAEDLRQAGAKTLMLSLDDTLRYLPFAALHDDQGYLVESLSLVMVTEAVRDKLAKAPNAKWSVWGMGVTQGGADYPPLPYAGAELNGITGQKGILAGKVMLDKQFNENSFRDGLDQGYPIIHIASHFQFTPGSMDDSFLLLGDGSHMTLAQIKTKLNFNGVELLTLSACETALGDDSVAHHGVEVEGLGAIAQQAGAQAVLATLWPVADASTALLMKAMYQAHKNDHVDKADALRSAQLSLLRGTVHADSAGKSVRGLTRVASAASVGNFTPDPGAPFAHPFYWAPFILMGNWQ